MPDDANSESNLNLGEDSQITTGGDVTAGNKITAGGHVIHAEAGATVVVSAQPPPTAPADAPPAPGESPFKGLQYFDVADAELFFGREALVEKLAGRLLPRGDAPPPSFLAIVGASGSGKSSLVRAGLVPRLQRQNPSWQVHIITPTAHPLKELAASLTRDSESLTATTTLMDDLAREGRSLDLAASRLLKKVGSGERLLLVVDQFEELFTACKDEAERQAFLDNVLTAVAPETAGPTLVVLTLRADFYAHCAQYANLREAIAAQQEYIGPMGAEELRRAIEEPAARGGWAFESGLVDLLLRDVGAGENRQPEPGALPLLSHALLETWKRRSGRTLTLKGYEESGGVRGAIAKTAETVYGQLSPESQPIARNIFLRLTELGEGTQDTRRRASLDELITDVGLQPLVESVLKVLADARLITTGEQAAEVAHEALIREWPALRGWLDENREGLRLHRHLTEAAGAWAKLDRDPGELYRGARLTQAVEWAGANDDQLNALEREFITVSKDFAEREVAEREAQRRRELEAAQKLAETEKQAAARMRVRNRIIIGVGAVAIVLAVIALVFGAQSNRNAIQAGENLSTAQAASTQAVSQQKTAVVAQGLADQRRDEAERQSQIAFAGKLAAQGQALYEDNPLLGLRLALESFAFAPPDDEATRGSTTDMLRKLIASGRVLKLGDDVAAIYPNPDNTLLVIDYATKPDELRRTADGSLVQTLSGNVGYLYFSPDPQASYFVVTYDDGKPGELRRAADGRLVQTFSSDVSDVVFSPDPQASYFVVNYYGKPGELRRTTDGSLAQTLSGYVSLVDFSPDPQASYFVVSYDDTPDELRSTADGSIVPLSGVVSSVDFSPDPQASFFVVHYADDTPGELRRIADGRLVQTLSGAVYTVFFSPDPQASYFVVSYFGDRPGELRRTAGGSLVQTLSSVVRSVNFSPDPQASFFVVSYPDGTPDELRSTADGSVVPLSGAVSDVVFSPDPQASYFAVSYFSQKPGELRRTADGSIVPLSGAVFSVVFSPDPQASYFVVSYPGGTLGELRRTADGRLVQTFSSDVSDVVFSPDPQASYLVVNYYVKPGELLRTADGNLVQNLSGVVSFVDFSPDPQASYFVVHYKDDTSELWATRDEPQRLSRLGLGLSDDSFFAMSSQHFILRYNDGRAYTLDLALLSAVGGDPESLSPEELTRIACEQLFQPGEFDEAQLGPYLAGREARGCK